jgi:hypothetical protein
MPLLARRRPPLQFGARGPLGAVEVDDVEVEPVLLPLQPRAEFHASGKGVPPPQLKGIAAVVVAQVGATRVEVVLAAPLALHGKADALALQGNSGEAAPFVRGLAAGSAQLVVGVVRKVAGQGPAGTLGREGGVRGASTVVIQLHRKTCAVAAGNDVEQPLEGEFAVDHRARPAHEFEPLDLFDVKQQGGAVDACRLAAHRHAVEQDADVAVVEREVHPAHGDRRRPAQVARRLDAGNPGHRLPDGTHAEGGELLTLEHADDAGHEVGIHPRAGGEVGLLLDHREQRSQLGVFLAGRGVLRAGRRTGDSKQHHQHPQPATTCRLPWRSSYTTHRLRPPCLAW